MNINHIVHNLFQENLLTKALELKDGQLVYGKLTKLFPQQMAEVQIGSQKMLANLTIPVTIDQSYWFQVSLTDDKPVLKVLTQANEAADKGNKNKTGLLQQLNLPNSKENRMLLHYLLSNNLPITKESIVNVREWLPSSFGKQELSVIGLMIERDLPLTNEVFSSISSLRAGKGISGLIGELQQQLSVHKIEEPLLNNLLSSLREGGDLTQGNIVDTLKSMFDKMGYSFEAGLLKRASMGEVQASQEMLKPVLLELMGKDVPNFVKETAAQLIDKVTGYQLMSQQSGPIMQLITEIPLRFFNQQVDVTMQYNGRKTADGKVDSNYCRILFYLELAHLQDTVIDINIQNRIMNMSILNDRAPEIMSLIKQVEEPLKEKLRDIDYKLMSVYARPLTQEDKPVWSSQQAMRVNTYKGVDLKI